MRTGDAGEFPLEAAAALNACATSITVGREPVLGMRECLGLCGGRLGVLDSVRTTRGGVGGGEGGDTIAPLSSLLFTSPGRARFTYEGA